MSRPKSEKTILLEKERTIRKERREQKRQEKEARRTAREIKRKAQESYDSKNGGDHEMKRSEFHPRLCCQGCGGFGIATKWLPGVGPVCPECEKNFDGRATPVVSRFDEGNMTRPGNRTLMDDSVASAMRRRGDCASHSQTPLDRPSRGRSETRSGYSGRKPNNDPSSNRGTIATPAEKGNTAVGQKAQIAQTEYPVAAPGFGPKNELGDKGASPQFALFES